MDYVESPEISGTVSQDASLWEMGLKYTGKEEKKERKGKGHSSSSPSVSNLEKITTEGIFKNPVGQQDAPSDR